MQERTTIFVDVILPVPIHNSFTYRVPFDLNHHIKIGTRVLVPFGKSKLYTALVVKLHEQAPVKYAAKYIEHVLDDEPIVNDKQLEFWNWISNYYMSPIGDVMNAALPSNFKLASETKIIIHPDYEPKIIEDDREHAIIEALEIKEVLNLKEISEILDIKTIQPIIKKMLDKKMVLSIESIKDKFNVKTATFVKLAEEYKLEANLTPLLEEYDTKKSKAKQLEALMILLSLCPIATNPSPILKKTLEEKGASSSALKSLQQNGVIVIEKLSISRLDTEMDEISSSFDLSDVQLTCLDEIKESFNSKTVTLLHGVTGSGKTEVYVKLIEEQLALGNQILFLVPEIALTTQLVSRLTVFFGEKIGVYHSKFNQNERVEIWNKVLQNDPNQYRIVLGARSCVFLPYQKLGLVIVDEEHETSFKQHDPSPRYNGRDAAIVLAHFHKAKVLLGSATPSMETYYNCEQDKYGLVNLSTRYKGMEMPEILMADLRKERKRNPDFQFFTTFLIDEMREALNKGEQIILFQNRRGYNPRWQCEVCSWTPKCVNCDVSLTYHKNSNTLKCHYCGYFSPPVGSCDSCGSNRLKMIGFGTEKIEDEMSMIFPKAVIGRLDLDTTRNKYGYENIITGFANRQIDILVGTQMISKGLDFENVSLVGILDAEGMLNRPDFRAFERSFQMMTQVGGRAGRKKKRGKVIIQTGQVDHWILDKVSANDYIGFYNHEKIERNNFVYPPFSKIIEITIKHKSENILEIASRSMAKQLEAIFGKRVIGPEYAIVPRVNNYFIKVIKIKFEKALNDSIVKEKIHHVMDSYFSQVDHKSTRVSINVDPI
jgi:primosomal protein N' (replication factor Y)